MRLQRTTKHENKVERAGCQTGQSMIQATLDGDCLEVGKTFVRR
jgi:hypothetical protein